MGNALSLIRSTLDGHLLLKAALLDLTIQWLCCPVAFYYQTDKIFDLVGSSTFFYLSWVTLMWSKRGTGLPFFRRQFLQSFCVSVWCVRLGTFLFARQRKQKKDKRFYKVKNNPLLCFKFWTIQGVWVYSTLLPTFILNMRHTDKTLGTLDFTGFTLWACGFLVEAVADYQKSVFRDNPNNRGKFITTGLWSVSRHPNYLGEILLWVGLFLPAANVMEGLEYLSVLSPLFVAYLLTNISGVPLLERQADQRWGSLVEYQLYKNKTAKVFPFLW